MDDGTPTIGFHPINSNDRGGRMHCWLSWPFPWQIVARVREIYPEPQQGDLTPEEAFRQLGKELRDIGRGVVHFAVDWMHKGLDFCASDNFPLAAKAVGHLIWLISSLKGDKKDRDGRREPHPTVTTTYQELVGIRLPGRQVSITQPWRRVAGGSGWVDSR